MTIKFQILIFYRDDSSLKQYLDQFWFSGEEDFKMTAHVSGIEVNSEHVRIRCVRGLSHYARGYRAHIVAVQEDLTWREDWNEIRDCVLRPTLFSPIDIQIFDGGI